MNEIAGLPDLSEKTVEFHKHHIMDVFNLKSNRRSRLTLASIKRVRGHGPQLPMVCPQSEN
jgi:DNA-binding NarL/FixJ family response regulator